ncbi:MAG: hypothetical protein AAB071_00200, partial [Bacteroidota bacterium]
NVQDGIVKSCNRAMNVQDSIVKSCNRGLSVQDGIVKNCDKTNILQDGLKKITRYTMFYLFFFPKKSAAHCPNAQRFK